MSTSASGQVTERLDEASQKANSRIALLALGAGGFSIGTGEFVIMGLLPEVARDLSISIPGAAHLISTYALGVVAGAPLLAVLTARWQRRALLMALMTFYAAANVATSLVPGYLAVGVARFASGLPHGAYFGVAALVAASMALPHQRARAVGLVMLGLALAPLVGVPLATWAGQHLGWRAAFMFVAVIAAIAALLIRFHVPDVAADANASPLRELGALVKPQVLLTLAIAGIGFGGMFCVFSYIKPTLLEVSGLSVDRIPLVLSLFGFGCIAGNLIGARLADRALMPTIGGVLIYSTLLLFGFGALIQTIPTALAGVFLLGGIVAWARPADQADGRCGRRADHGRGTESFRVQFRQRAGRLARRIGGGCRLGLDVTGLGRIVHGNRRITRIFYLCEPEGHSCTTSAMPHPIGKQTRTRSCRGDGCLHIA